MIMAGFVLGPGEGRVYEFHGSTVVIKASGEDSLLGRSWAVTWRPRRRRPTAGPWKPR
jgi:hypothetical protein